jgi:calcium-dependent protein kinase
MFESKNDLSARIKVLDFGLSRKFLPGMSKLMTEGVGTLYTMSPQVLNGIYSSSADCWSLGVIAFILLSQRKPFAAKTRSKTKELIMRCQYQFTHRDWDGISHDAKDFVSSLIVYDPIERLTAKQALEHPWLKKYSDEKNNRTSIEYKKQTSLMNHVHDNIIGYARMSTLKRIASVVVAHKSSAGKCKSFLPCVTYVADTKRLPFYLFS